MARARGGVPERPKGTGCKPVGSAYGGSNPPAPTLSSMVDELRALVRGEREDADESERLRRLDDDVALVRQRAEATERFFALERVEADRLSAAEAEAREQAERRSADLAEAENELAQAGDDDERALAEQRVTRARDHVEVAAHAAERAAEARAAFDLEGTRLRRELPELEARAASLTAEIPGADPPGADGLVEWAARAHAAIFVAQGQVDVRRERTIREANELATSLLGEPTYGSTPEQALARVERYWTSSPGQVSDKR
jgi:hypothetical protein